MLPFVLSAVRYTLLELVLWADLKGEGYSLPEVGASGLPMQLCPVGRSAPIGKEWLCLVAARS